MHGAQRRLVLRAGDARKSPVASGVSPKWEKSNFIEDVRVATALYKGFLPRFGPPARVAPLLCNPRLRSSTGPSVPERLLSAHTGCRSDYPRRGTVQARVAQV